MIHMKIAYEAAVNKCQDDLNVLQSIQTQELTKRKATEDAAIQRCVPVHVHAHVHACSGACTCLRACAHACLYLCLCLGLCLWISGPGHQLLGLALRPTQ